MSRASAQAEMDAIAARLETQYPENAGQGVRLNPLHDEIVGDVRPALLVLLGAVCCVLLIACANVANLLLTRAASRQKELAIRAALGASRPRLVRQMLTESLVLSAVGGAAGLLLAAWGVEMLQAIAPPSVPRLTSVAIDARVLGYTLMASVMTGLVFGAIPAFQGAASAANESLKEGGRAGTEGIRGRRARTVLAVTELAAALVLLIGAGLLVRTFVAIGRLDPGFEPRHVLALRLELPRLKYAEPARVSAFYDRLLARFATLPGVEGAAGGTSLLLSRLPQSSAISIEGQPRQSATATNIPVPYDSVTPGFFKILRIPLVRGRFFTDADGPDTERVVLVNDAFTARFFPGRDAIDHRVTFGDPSRPETRWFRIVGVVADTRRGGFDRPAWAEVYFAHRQQSDRRMFVVLRTTGDPAGLARAAQAAVWDVDRDQPVTSVRTLEQLLHRPAARHLCRGCAHARCDRRVRRDCILDRAAYARDRHPRRAGRRATRRDGDGAARWSRGGGRRGCAWNRGSRGADTIAGGLAVRRRSTRSTHVRRSRGGAARGCGRRDVSPCAPRDSGGADDCAPRRMRS
jgi:putative ABC transport system permease protein